jgi:anaerobic selenocysteine-containing dehydrogenase
MKTPDSSDVIQGDEECRDGHYRAKQDLRTITVTSTRGEPTAELDPNSSISLQAQNPIDLGQLTIGRASDEAAGIPAIWNTMLYGIGEMGPIRAPEAFLKINQVTGFDCQSCAWPSPDKKRKTFEFCENGAKAVSDESTKKRIGAEFFAMYSIAELAAKSDYWLNQQGRLTSPMVRHANATHYQPITWPDAFAMLAQELNALDSPDQASFYTSGKTTNEPAFCSYSRGSSEPIIFRIARTCATSPRESRW